MAISLLRRCPLLKAMPAFKLRRILRISRSLTVPAGELIFNKQDLARHMFIVESGRVKIFSTSNSKKRKTFAYLGPGAFFGEMALLDAQERSASAVAVEDSRLIVIPRRDFKRFLLSDSHLCYLMLRTLSQRLRAANEQIESLLFDNILGRVAKTLYAMARRGGKKSREGILIRERYTQQELADIVGTTREPLARALTSLRRAQLIRTHQGRIRLYDLPRLETLAGAPV